MIPHPHSENLEKKRKEPTNTNTAYTINTLDTSVAIIITVFTKTIIAITNIISTIVILSNTVSNIHCVISDMIYTDLNSDNTKLTSNDDNNTNSSIIKDNSFTKVNRCKDIRIHKTKDTIKILS